MASYISLCYLIDQLMLQICVHPFCSHDRSRIATRASLCITYMSSVEGFQRSLPSRERMVQLGGDHLTDKPTLTRRVQ